MNIASFATGSMWAGFIAFMGEAAEEIVALAQELGSQGHAIRSHGLTA